MLTVVSWCTRVDSNTCVFVFLCLQVKSTSQKPRANNNNSRGGKQTHVNKSADASSSSPAFPSSTISSATSSVPPNCDHKPPEDEASSRLSTSHKDKSAQSRSIVRRTSAPVSHCSKPQVLKPYHGHQSSLPLHLEATTTAVVYDTPRVCPRSSSNSHEEQPNSSSSPGKNSLNKSNSCRPATTSSSRRDRHKSSSSSKTRRERRRERNMVSYYCNVIIEKKILISKVTYFYLKGSLCCFF